MNKGIEKEFDIVAITLGDKQNRMSRELELARSEFRANEERNNDLKEQIERHEKMLSELENAIKTLGK